MCPNIERRHDWIIAVWLGCFVIVMSSMQIFNVHRDIQKLMVSQLSEHMRPKRKRTSWLVFTARFRPQLRMPPVRGSVVRIRGLMRTQHFWIRTSLSSTAAALYTTIGGRLPECTGDTDAKNDGPEFWNLNSVIFENFLNFQKGVARSLCSRSGPLWSRPN